MDRRGWKLTLLTATMVAALLFVADSRNNPPGFYIDESSISYNAHLIAQTGRDEHNEAWPLFFRAFGDYKNPVYIYLLAGVFRVTGPSMLAARLSSAAMGIVAALLLGLLAAHVTQRRAIGLIITLMALLTPWLIELSRVALEVALYPLVLTLFLLCVHHASTKVHWAWPQAVYLSLTLALVTYTYSIGRLLGPLLALGLLFFASRPRRAGLFLAWAFYAITLFPMFIFHRRHPGALAARFSIITYITPDSSPPEITWEFVKHYVGNFNLWRLLVVGDPNIDQIAHLHGAELILAATGVSAVLGIWVILRHRRREAWWRFVIYGLAVSVVPAALTQEYVHMLRLAPLPVFFVVLTIPALEWLAAERGRRRVALKLLILLMVLQGAAFHWRFHANAHSPWRLHLFDAEYPQRILEPALATRRPIYLADALAIPGYIQAYWYATLRELDLSTFRKLPAEVAPPVGALVISTEENCVGCEILAEVAPYRLYVAHEPPRPRSPLSDSAFRAQIEVRDPPTTLSANYKTSIHVRVKNLSGVTWLARERTGGMLQVSLGNHWLDRNGRMLIHDDARSALLVDLHPGEETELKLTINTPKNAGEYLLELDMLQESVSWFGLKGSQTLRLPVRIESSLFD